MSQINMVHIDFDRFIAEVEKTNVPKKIILKGIGYSSDTFFTNAKFRGKISLRSADELERIYGIKRKAYEIPAPKPEEPKPEESKPVEEPKQESAEEPKCSIDYVRLYNTIYQAVLTALQENAKGLHDRLFEVK